MLRVPEALYIDFLHNPALWCTSDIHLLQSPHIKSKPSKAWSTHTNIVHIGQSFFKSLKNGILKSFKDTGEKYRCVIELNTGNILLWNSHHNTAPQIPQHIHLLELFFKKIISEKSHFMHTHIYKYINTQGNIYF